MQSTIKDIDFYSVLNSIQDPTIIIDLNGIIIFKNTHASDLKYLDIHVNIGISIYDVIPIEKRSIVKSLIQNLLISKTPFRTTVERKVNGIKYHFEARYCPVLDESNNLIYILIETRDISVEKIFSNKIKRVEGDLTSLIEKANAVIIGTDSQGYITDWNKMCETLTGYSKREALASPLHELLLDRENRMTFHLLMKPVLAGEPLNNYELPVRTKDDRLLTVLINATPRLNHVGNVDGILLVGQDISELIAYRNSLEEKVEERTEKLNQSNKELSNQKEIIEAEKKKSDQLLLNILPEFVAMELKDNGYVAPKHFPEATIIFTDLVGFTKLSASLSPEEIVHELNYIFVGFDMILAKNNIEKIKTIGDGYLAVAGIPIENKTHAIDAVSASLEIVSFVDRINKDNMKAAKPPWQVRIGIHTGELIAGVIGKDKFAYDIWGGAVNTASRMESAGEPGKVNISSSTYQLVRKNFACTHRGSVEVKNMGLLDMYFVDNRI